jgi:hypothetical protein
LMGLGRRQVFRLRRAFCADGALALVRQHYRFWIQVCGGEACLVPGTEPRRGDAEAMDDRGGVGSIAVIASPLRTSRAGDESARVNWCRSTVRSTRGSKIAATHARRVLHNLGNLFEPMAIRPRNDNSRRLLLTFWTLPYRRRYYSVRVSTRRLRCDAWSSNVRYLTAAT